MVLWFPVLCSLLVAAAPSSFSQGCQVFPSNPGPCPQKIQKVPRQNPESAAQTLVGCFRELCSLLCQRCTEFGTGLSCYFLGFAHYLGWKQQTLVIALYLSHASVLNKEVAPSFWHMTANCPIRGLPALDVIPQCTQSGLTFLTCQHGDFWALRAVCRLPAGPMPTKMLAQVPWVILINVVKSLHLQESPCMHVRSQMMSVERV